MDVTSLRSHNYENVFQERFRLERSYTLSELSRAKRQFITYAKARAVEDVGKLATMFVQYLNTSMV